MSESFKREELSRAIVSAVGPTRWYPGDDYAIEFYDDLSFPCPMDDCKTGIMEDTGNRWPTGSMGYHYKCDECDIIFAVHLDPPAYLKVDDNGQWLMEYDMEKIAEVQDRIDENRKNSIPRPIKET